MAKVVVKQRGVPPITYDLQQEETVVGRSTEADILLPHNSVSRKQATITEDSRGYSIDDSGSRNGMLVNGQLVTQHRLQDGDTIEVGLFRITFQGDRPIAEAMQPSTLALEQEDPLSFDAPEDQATRMVRRGPDGKPILPKRPRSRREFNSQGEITGGFGLPVTQDKNGKPLVKRSPEAPILHQRNNSQSKASEGDRIAVLLKSNGLEEYASVFSDNEITVDILPDITEADLRDLGIEKLGPRKRLMRAINQLLEGE